MKIDVDTLVRDARVEEAIAELESVVRRSPADAGPRTHLFQLMCLTGQWMRAGQQIAALGALDAKLMPTVTAYRGLVETELYRAEVFAGRTMPMLVGEPQPWMAQWIQGAACAARGDYEQAAELRQSALTVAPPTPFVADGVHYDGLLDADTRLGPMLEVVLEGNYMWMPIVRARELEIYPPESLADLVWARIRLVSSAGGEMSGYVPTRYVGTETRADNQMRMSRSTVFDDLPCGASHATGQRLFLTGGDEVNLLRLGHAVFEEQI